jgi:DNA repair and recombination RAD54-like protein
VEDEDKDANVDMLQPISFKKDSSWNPVAVGNDTFTEQQKQSRFTWELERRKKHKLGMKTNPLYERDLNSDSNSSGSDQIRKYGFKRDGSHKVDRKKKHTSSKSGKKPSSAIMLKRQSLLKLLVDKMSGDKSLESFPFDQNPQLQFIFKEMHPLVFSFGDEDLVAAYRPEQDVGLDMLWADFDFALESENIGTYYDDEVHLNICRCVVLVFIFFLSIKTHADLNVWLIYLNTDSTTRTMIKLTGDALSCYSQQKVCHWPQTQKFDLITSTYSPSGTRAKM